MATTAKTKTRSKAAPKPPSRKIDDKKQYDRFREFAREHGADSDSKTFDQRFKSLVKSADRQS